MGEFHVADKPASLRTVISGLVAVSETNLGKWPRIGQKNQLQVLFFKMSSTAMKSISFLFLLKGSYKRVTSGTCKRIVTRAECNYALTQLGLSQSDYLNQDERPPYCFYYANGGATRFNVGSNVEYNYACNSDKVCICKQ